MHMSQVTQAFPHLKLEKVKHKLKQADKYWERQKWLVIYNAMIDPRPAAEIAKHAGVSKGFVSQVIQQYNRQGEAAVSTPGKGGRRNCYLSWEQELQLIGSFKEKARKGYIATAKEIKIAYAQKIGHQVHKTTIYRLLERHEWHKIVPRPSHPKENFQAQEEFKKTLLCL
jgi:transposase